LETKHAYVAFKVVFLYKVMISYNEVFLLIVCFIIDVIILYTNIDQTLPNKLHGQTHCKIWDTCEYIGHGFYTLL